MLLIDGKTIATRKLEDLKSKIQKLGTRPKLAIVMVPGDPATETYVRLKRKAAEQVGITTELRVKGEEVKENELIEEIKSLNDDGTVDGILVQLPLPSGLHPDTERIVAAIAPEKDVDGLTGRSGFMPATVKAILTALDEVLGSRDQVLGKDVTIIGRSQEVGRPLAMAMIDLGATVTICNSKTKDLGQKTKVADILVSATGRPGLVTAEMVKPGAVVIDVGYPKGDVDFEKVKNVASAITPVPGGIGPLTVVSLLENTFEAAKIQSSNMASV